MTARKSPKSGGSRVRKIRLLVTGHDRQGRSVIVSDKPSPHTTIIDGVANFGTTDLWKTVAIPADNEVAGDPCNGPTTLAPPPKGIVLRVVQFPPDATYVKKFNREKAFASLGKSGAAVLVRGKSSERHPMMHRTESEDYAIVLSGEVWSVMDKGEAKMRAGDILVQRGTNHAWSNRTNKPCLICFVQIDAKPGRRARGGR